MILRSFNIDVRILLTIFTGRLLTQPIKLCGGIDNGYGRVQDTMSMITGRSVCSWNEQSQMAISRALIAENNPTLGQKLMMCQQHLHILDRALHNLPGRWQHRQHQVITGWIEMVCGWVRPRANLQSSNHYR